ncbi:MAG: FMN-binding protein [Sulfurovum sp.]|nr:FMN-binding protein [Sulfurovum sp.]
MHKIFMTLLFGILLSQSSVAKNNSVVDNAIKSSFTRVNSIEPKNIILTNKQFSQVKSRAKTAVKTKIYRYYDIKNKTKRLGYAILISRVMRTKKATVLYAFDTSGTLRFTEILAFGEPPEYIPNKTWMGQLQNRDAATILTIGKDMPTISGSTLSARAITQSARVARAIYEIVLK